jgi:glucose-1-phosphate cytidylyltransferase
MKAVILAGGLGTRLSEETSVLPKPMVAIGGQPILWHIMKMYSAHGINDFVICLGYRGIAIKQYFDTYFLHTSDVTFDLVHNTIEVHRQKSEPWRVTLIETGETTQTGGRLKRVRQYLDDDEPFCFTYGDGVADVNIRASIDFHRRHGALATLTAAQPTGRFGALSLDGDTVTSFREKMPEDAGFVNAGFFVLSPKVIDYITDDGTVFEHAPLERLALEGQMKAFIHKGFWLPMDTLRDKMALEAHWQSGRAPWKVWA